MAPTSKAYRHESVQAASSSAPSVQVRAIIADSCAGLPCLICDKFSRHRALDWSCITQLSHRPMVANRNCPCATKLAGNLHEVCFLVSVSTHTHTQIVTRYVTLTALHDVILHANGRRYAPLTSCQSSTTHALNLCAVLSLRASTQASDAQGLFFAHTHTLTDRPYMQRHRVVWVPVTPARRRLHDTLRLHSNVVQPVRREPGTLQSAA